MWVVKLGGSLGESPCLKHWLETLVTHGGDKVVIVPGGGQFADQVRRSQACWSTDNGTAHIMALLAMEQFGLLMTGICPGLVPVRDRPALRDALASGGTPVWLPSAMVGTNDLIPADWSVTSDSLSMWLTGILGAQGLLLVKSVALPHHVTDAYAAVSAGLVDEAFPGFQEAAGRPVDWLTGEEYGRFESWLEGDDRVPGFAGSRLQLGVPTAPDHDHDDVASDADRRGAHQPLSLRTGHMGQLDLQPALRALRSRPQGRRPDSGGR
jgi:5-(aminomethyl)-3-furanmethanol phosphate kinase